MSTEGQFRKGANMGDFVVEHYADFGTGEPWVARLMLGLRELVFAVPAFAETRQDFMDELGEVFEALGMAFQELRTLSKKLANGAPVLEVTQSYETFYGHLWRAHRDSFPAVMRALGLDIGFYHRKDAEFERGATRLLSARPELADLVDLMRRDRADSPRTRAEERTGFPHVGAQPTPCARSV